MNAYRVEYTTRFSSSSGNRPYSYEESKVACVLADVDEIARVLSESVRCDRQSQLLEIQKIELVATCICATGPVEIALRHSGSPRALASHEKTA